jgi:proline iminopeptidase
MPTLTINGAEIYYEILGEQNDQAVMALHGGPGIADHRGEQSGLGGLSDQYKLVTYDHRGCGRSSETPPYTNEQYVEDAEALRQELGLGKIILYGGSYGGFIAQLYALKYPENLSHLILRDTSPNNQFVSLAKQNALSRMDKAPGITEEMLDRMFDGKVRDNDDFKVLYEAILPLYFVGDQAHEAREKQDIFYHYETHNVMFSNEFSAFDLSDKLTSINTPTLVTVGKHDWITPPVAAKLIAEQIPNSTLVQFENSGHSPQLEESDLYVATVKQFLNKEAT